MGVEDMQDGGDAQGREHELREDADERMEEGEIEDGNEDAQEDEEDEDEDAWGGDRDAPELGDTVRGRVLVCRGDDEPDEFDASLDGVASRFRQLSDIAGRYGLSIGAPDFDEGLVAFLEQAGVDFESSHWEGSCTSGIYQMGWVATRRLGAVERTAYRLLDRAEREMQRWFLKEARARFKKATAECDLDALVKLTENHAPELWSELRELQRQNAQLVLRIFTLEYGKGPVDGQSGEDGCAVGRGKR